MKKLFLALLLLCSSVQASILDLKLSTAQIFDVQWYISGSTLNASVFSYIYASVNYATQTADAQRWTAEQTADASSNGRYIGFFNSTTNPDTYGMAVFNSDGTIYKKINNTGSFVALADGAIFYNGDDMWGTLITTGQGYNYGQSGSWAVTTDNPTNSQLQAYVPPSSEPLAAGQTVAWSPPPPPPPPPAATSLCCGGSSATFNADAANTARVQTFAARATQDSQVRIEQIGTGNKITVDQSGTRNNYAKYTGNGSNNIVVVTQSGNGSTQANYVDAVVTGSNNTVTLQQPSTGGAKGIFATVNNNSNTLIIQQKDNGSHYADVSLSGGAKNVDITQQGSASQMAKITLSGNPTDLSLSQSGAVQNFYSLNFNCATAGGCAKITVRQGN